MVVIGALVAPAYPHRALRRSQAGAGN